MSLLQSVQPQIQFLYSMNHNKKIKSNLNWRRKEYFAHHPK